MLNKPSPIFFDQTEVEQMTRYLHSAESEGTVDELGFGQIYLKLANSLFPWCSTLTTRARYFFWSSAVIMLAADLASNSLNNGTRGESRIGREETLKAKKVFRDNVKYLETYLGLSLYAWTAKQSGSTGVFGKRNINQRINWKISDFRKKGILSMENRYPNAIYRGSLNFLGLFREEDKSSNISVILGDAKSKQGSEYEIFSSEWKEMSLIAKNELIMIYDFFEANKNISFNSIDQKLLNFLERKDFRGFVPAESEAEFLKEKIQEKSPYLKEIDWRNLKQINNLEDMANLLPLSNKYRELLLVAHDIDLITAPFREIYIYLKKGNTTDIRGKQLPGTAGYQDWKKRYSRIISKDRLNSKDDLDFMDEWSKILKKSNGIVTNNLIEAIAERATTVVQGRGKFPPHLATINKDDLDAFDEVDSVETSFRRGNAIRIIKDLVG
jgi:hypothetical protein